MRFTSLASTVVSACLACAAACAADLPFGERVEGRTTSDRSASYAFETDEPGVLAVVVRADGDVYVDVLNDDAQHVPDGRLDVDLGGDVGAEQGLIMLATADAYELRISPFDAEARFVLTASWMPMPEIAKTVAPLGSALDALDLEINQTREARIDASSRRHWYRIVAPADGLLLVATKAGAGDVILERHTEDDPEFSAEQSDRDIGGDLGREAILVDVHAGDTYYFVVSAHGDQADYSIRGVLTDN